MPPDRSPDDHEADDHEVLERAATDDGFRRELEEWRDAAIAAERATGEREETLEEAERHVIFRIGRMSLGAVLVVLGVALLVLPGPGFLCMAAGLAILAKDVPFADRWLQKVRRRLPEGEEGELSKGFIIGCVISGVVLLGASIWFTFFRGDFDVPYLPLI